jgi:hypothetical protein
VLHGSLFIGCIDDIFYLAPSILNFALHLLNHSFYLKVGIPGELA